MLQINSSLDSGEVFGVELTSDVGENVYELTRVCYHHKHPYFFTVHFSMPKVSLCNIIILYKCVHVFVCMCA